MTYIRVDICHCPSCISLMHPGLMEESREKYETYPKYLVPEFARITCIGKAGQDNEEVISEAPYRGMTDDIRAGRYFDASYHRIHR